jgi:pimeloyl-ACP methyl ester carboxylesterase
MSGTITERRIDAGGIGIHLRELAGEGTPTVFIHGNPTNSLDWVPFMERMRGPAVAPDLPGFGRSERPGPERFDASMWAYADLLAELLPALGPDGYRLVVHDWGGIALAAASRRPELVERLVVINAVPLLAGYRWHWVAQIWRRRGLGELFNAMTSRRATALLLRLARSGRRPMPEEFVDMVWEGWDAGSRRAVLALYRSADPAELAAVGSRLGELACPALVLWGTDDPYIPARFAGAYAARLPGAEVELVGGASHWPWIDRPEVIDRVVGFLE